MEDQRIALLSDSHDAGKNLRWALEELRSRDIREIIFCGDLKSPEMLSYFEGFRFSMVLGNADRDEEGIRGRARELFGPNGVSRTFEAERAGTRIAVAHGHTRRLRELIEAGRYDYVIHGHTHRRRDETIGGTRVINPGALGGIKRESRSLCLLDPAAGTVEFLEMET
jgi:hypothetical protein